MHRIKAEALALKLMREFGLLEKGWKFSFANTKNRAGACWYCRRLIQLSRHYVSNNEEPLIENTIRHEIAHALTGYHHGHDNVWKATAVRCGAKPQACLDEGVKVADYSWIGTCPSCLKSFKRHKRGKLACSKCCNAFNNGKCDDRFLLRWRRNDAD